ncbi:hypothetical protein ACFOPS_21945 [Ralstonia solanacearum]|uniref:hypothetical protein n=2 Tax=Ralstonia solanacearum TaxID=305 RepID=UPI00269A7DA5
MPGDYTMELNRTHDASRRSWLDEANIPGTDFPLQNLPLCVFRRKGSDENWRGGVAIGDPIVDLAALQRTTCLQDLAAEAVRAAAAPKLNALLDLGPSSWQALRHGLFDLLQAGSAHEQSVRETLVPQSEAEHAVPVDAIEHGRGNPYAGAVGSTVTEAKRNAITLRDAERDERHRIANGRLPAPRQCNQDMDDTTVVPVEVNDPLEAAARKAEEAYRKTRWR